ncbi:hypothetical protein [Burkholderia thailandensis]|uniref:hypothetical protein n=1 Tax=Burkholderia thailandensis TaxID=57975 RepID=UPI00107E74A5|nr:hypothetical protein [Burkholderia thailandensis]TGB34373.1 hypothetical protein C6946_07015 [Burkholderia thailandensis]
MVNFTDNEILAIRDRAHAALTKDGNVALGYELDIAFGRAMAEAAIEKTAKAAPEPVRHITVAGGAR